MSDFISLLEFQHWTVLMTSGALIFIIHSSIMAFATIAAIMPSGATITAYFVNKSLITTIYLDLDCLAKVTVPKCLLAKF